MQEMQKSSQFDAEQALLPIIDFLKSNDIIYNYYDIESDENTDVIGKLIVLGWAPLYIFAAYSMGEELEYGKLVSVQSGENPDNINLVNVEELIETIEALWNERKDVDFDGASENNEI